MPSNNLHRTQTSPSDGITIWYLWLDGSTGTYKHGDHWVWSMTDKEGYQRPKTWEEIVAEVTAYLTSSSYLGRNAGARAKLQKILAMYDVTDYAIKKDRHGPNKHIDELIEKQTNLRYHRLEDKDSLNPQTITTDEILREVNKEVYGSRNLAIYDPYQEQCDARDKAYGFFTQGETDFLLDCVMRFGKCFTSYMIAKVLGVKRILILTGRPKVKNGWNRDLDHVMFDRWEWIDNQTQKNRRFSQEDPLFTFEDKPEVEVIFASLQGSNRKNLESRLAGVLEQDIDLVIVDEFHAYLSPDVMKFILSLRTPRRLWVSGTPFKAYENGMFNGDDDTYRFTIMDAMRAKKAGHPRYKNFPDIQFWVWKYPDWSKSTHADKLINEQGLNMPLLLSNNAGTTNYPTEVRWLLDSIAGSDSRYGSVIGLGPREIGTRGIKPIAPKHIWWSVPAGADDTKEIGVAAATTLENELPSHPFFKDYPPLVVKGDKSEDDVVHHHTQNPNGSSVASCRSLNTGTKFDLLDTVIFLRETISAAEYWQTVGRALQPHEGKDVINILITSVELVVQMADAMADQRSDNSSHYEAIEEFFSLMPAHMMGEAQVIQLDADRAYSMLETTGSPTKSFKSRAMFVSDIIDKILDDPEFAASFPDIDKEDGNRSVELHKSAVDKGKNKSRVLKGENTKQEKDFANTCLDRIREFMRLTVTVQSSCLVHEDYQIKSLDDLKSAPVRPIDSVLGPGTKALFDGLLERGWIHEKDFDRKIGKSFSVYIKDNL